MTSIPSWLQEHCLRLCSNDASLTNLNLNIRRLNADCMVALASALSQNSCLRTLNLATSVSNNASAVDTLSQRVMKSHESLQIVHLSYNRLTNIESIGISLRTNLTLVELYLDYNNIADCQGLAAGLSHNRNLRVIQLESNLIDDEGCQELAKALSSNRCLKVLGLARNLITTVGASALEKALQGDSSTPANVTVVWIDLHRNHHVSLKQQGSVQLLCDANMAGRQFVVSFNNLYQRLQHESERRQQVPLSAWPYILRRITNRADLLFFFLKAKPDLYSVRLPSIDIAQLPCDALSSRGKRKKSHPSDLHAIDLDE